MKENYETVELCNMIAEKNYEAALEEAVKKIAQLEREKLSIERKSEARRTSDIFLAGMLGAFGTIAFFAIAMATYGWLWTTY